MKSSQAPAAIQTLEVPSTHDPPSGAGACGTSIDTRCTASIAGKCTVSSLCRGGADSLYRTLSDRTVGRRIIRRGEPLYRAGDTFTYLYRLHSGSVKLRITNDSGIEQIAAFPMAGTLLGLDGIETGTHTCDAVALELSTVCVLPVGDLLDLCSSDRAAALQFNKMIAHETTYYRNLLLVLACMKSEERIANFLLDLSGRMAASGYSSREFMLKMTREDIANHLGMKLETVSRIFTRLKLSRILDVRRRYLKIRNPDALKKMGNG